MSATWQWAKANPDLAARRIRELERENAELRKDKERIDWLENHSDNIAGFNQTRYPSVRAAIDAARKEAQP